MKIKTIERLLELLDEDLVWRKKELSAIKLFIEQSGGEDLKINTRMGIMMLYAHWEGYIKQASNYYIFYLSQFTFRYDELSQNFLTLSLNGVFTNCAQTKKVSVHCSLVNTLMNNLDQETKISYEDVVPERKTLDYDLLSEILFTLGIDKAPFELKKPLIDRSLVKHRGYVAHGVKTPVEKAEFDLLYNQVIDMTESFKKEVIIAARKESFRKTAN